MSLAYQDDWLTIYGGDCRTVLAELPAESVHCVVTSPPYWGLRDYGISDQLGLEPTPEQYVENMVAVFREVKRVLRSDGTVWLNLGDSYAATASARDTARNMSITQKQEARAAGLDVPRAEFGNVKRDIPFGLKPKDLVGIPWRVAFALQQPYYTGTIRNEADRVWLAAMIDAEGCIYVHRRQAGLSNGQGYVRKNDTHGAGLEVSNTSEAIVQRCMEITGRGSISRQDKDRRQPLYRWNLRTNECRDVLREIYPHLVAKKQQARIAIGCPASGEKAEAAFLAIQGLHHGSGTTVDFPAPESMWEPGWYLRSDVIWSKPNPMPESVTDRPTKSHEYLFLLTKSPRYFFDADAVREPHAEPTGSGGWQSMARNGESGWHARYPKQKVDASRNDKESANAYQYGSGRNIRTVWTVATQPYPGAHFAVFPEKLIEPCILAGTSERGVCPECGAPWVRETDGGEGTYATRKALGHDKPQNMVVGEHPGNHRGLHPAGMTHDLDPAPKVTTGWRPSCRCDPNLGITTAAVPATVLDPFGGSGTTARVANRLSRRAILIDLNPDYLKQQMDRNRDLPLGLGA